MANGWIEKIQDFVEQLKLMGYHDYQIKDILLVAGGSSDWRVLPQDKLVEVADHLEAQVEFARHCHSSLGKK